MNRHDPFRQNAFESARLATLIVAAYCLSAGTLACRPGTAMPEPDPVSPASLSPDVSIQQSVWVNYLGHSFIGRGVVQKQGSRLDLVLLSPAGNRLLTVSADGDKVSVESRIEAFARLDARHLLADVRWAFFGGCTKTAGGPSERTCKMGSTLVRETDNPVTGDLRHRSLLRDGAVSQIDFPEWAGPNEMRYPVKVYLQNDQLGYEWEIQVDAWKPFTP